MKKLRPLFFLVSSVSVVLFFLISPGTGAAQAPDPYQVTLFQDYNYSNPIGTWKLNPDMRMLQVPKIEVFKYVHSIFVGSKVGALLFPSYNLSSSLRLVQEQGSRLIPYFRFHDSSSTGVSEYGGWSLIIYRKDIIDILGVYLYTKQLPSDSWWLGGRFYPLPDDPVQSQITHSNMVSDIHSDLEFVNSTLSGAGWLGMLNYLDVTITFTTGLTLKLPDPNNLTFLYNLTKYKGGQISSIQLQYKGPFNSKQAYLTGPGQSASVVNAPPSGFDYTQGKDLPGQDYNKFMTKGDYVECARACDKDPQCRAFTWVKPGVKGVDAACCLKSGVPVATQNPNCISGVRVTVVNAPPTGPDTRYIPQTSDVAQKKQKSGSALATASKIPNISGQWKSSIGLVYDLTQQGNQFQWTVAKTNEKGQGAVNGTALSASWNGPQGSGSTTGQITGVDATGKATQIDWKNGVRFYR